MAATTVNKSGGTPAPTTVVYRDSKGQVISTTVGKAGQSVASVQDQAKKDYASAYTANQSTPNIAKNSGFWNSVSVGEINASGYKNLDEWKSAYESGKAVAPPSAIGNSFKFDAQGRMVDTVTGAIKPNVKQEASFYSLKDEVAKKSKISDFANLGGGKVYSGSLNDSDKAYLKGRGYEPTASFYDKDTGKGGEVYTPINQASIRSAPEIVQAGALVAEQVAKTPSSFSKVGATKIEAYTPSEETFLEQLLPIRAIQKAVFNREEYTAEDRRRIEEFATVDIPMTAFNPAGFVVKQVPIQAAKQTIKQVAKQETKATALTIAEQFAKTFGNIGKKILTVAGTRPGRIVTGLGIAAGGNVIGQASPEAFTQGQVGIERFTGSLDLGKTVDEQKKLDLAVAKTYEKTKNRFEGYIEESQDSTGKIIQTAKKGEGDEVSLLATQLVPGARMFTKYKDIFAEELVPALKEQGFTQAQIDKNKDAIIRSYLNARQTGATFGNIAVEVGGELGFRRLATGALKTPKISGFKSGALYGGKLGLLSTPFGGMEGYSQDVIESNATYRKRDAGRELQSAIYGGAISGAFNFSTGVAMGFGKRITQLVGDKKTPSAFKKGAELGGKTVTAIGYLADAPGEFIGDKSADVIERITKNTKKNIVNVPKGRISTIGFGSSTNTVSKSSNQQTGKPKVQTSSFLQGLFGMGSKNPNTKGGGSNQNTFNTDNANKGKGEAINDTRGNSKNNNVLDLGDNSSTAAQNETEQNTKQDTSVSTSTEVTDTVAVNVMSPVGRVGGFPFLPFGGSTQGSKRNRGTIKNELSEALGSMGLRTRQEASTGLDYVKKFNRLRK